MAVIKPVLLERSEGLLKGVGWGKDGPDSGWSKTNLDLILGRKSADELLPAQNLSDSLFQNEDLAETGILQRANKVHRKDLP